MKKKSILICEKCFSRNYNVVLPENRKERFSQKKYCKKCNLHTTHKENL